MATTTVIQDNGRTYQTYDVDSGQSTVILSLPANAKATVKELNVTTGGTKLL